MFGRDGFFSESEHLKTKIDASAKHISETRIKTGTISNFFLSSSGWCSSFIMIQLIHSELVYSSEIRP